MFVSLGLETITLGTERGVATGFHIADGNNQVPRSKIANMSSSAAVGGTSNANTTVVPGKRGAATMEVPSEDDARKRINSFLLRSGLTKLEMAEAIGYSPSTLVQFLNGPAYSSSMPRRRSRTAQFPNRVAPSRDAFKVVVITNRPL